MAEVTPCLSENRASSRKTHSSQKIHISRGSVHNSPKVHFAETIDWEEEDRRSALGSESRRKEKEAKRMASSQHDQRLSSILAVLRDEKNQGAITKLCSSNEIVGGAVWKILKGRGKRTTEKLAMKLHNFSKTTRRPPTLTTITVAQKNGLIQLNVEEAFTREFRRDIAAAIVVTSGSEEEDEDTRRDVLGRTRRERQRNWRQTVANAEHREGDPLDVQPPNVANLHD